MANTTVEFNMDDTAWVQASRICERLGMDLPTYLRMCVARMIQDNGIPFSMNVEEAVSERALNAMKAASRIAAEYGIADMTLDEINAEIAAARSEAAR